MVDEDDFYGHHGQPKVLIGAGAIVLGTAITAVTGRAGAAFYSILSCRNSGSISKCYNCSVVGAGTSVISNRMSTGSWKGSGKAALNGAINVVQQMDL